MDSCEGQACQFYFAEHPPTSQEERVSWSDGPSLDPWGWPCWKKGEPFKWETMSFSRPPQPPSARPFFIQEGPLNGQRVGDLFGRSASDLRRLR